MEKTCVVCKKEFVSAAFTSHLDNLKDHLQEVCDECKKENNVRAVNKKKYKR